jgi:hypothetical protein
MANHTYSDDEDLELARALSLLSPEDFDEQVAQIPYKGSAPPNHDSRPTTPPRDDKDDLALALRSLQLSSYDLDEASRLDFKAGGSTGGGAHLNIPPDKNDEGDIELALNLSKLPADIFDEEASERNRRREVLTAAEETIASLRPAISPSEVRTRHDLDAQLIMEYCVRMTSEEPSLGSSHRGLATTPNQRFMTIISRLWDWPHKAR